MIKKVIIPAAGLGTRFLPITKSIPKEMLPILNKPAIQYVVEEAIAAGIEDFCIITSKGKEAISDYFSNYKSDSFIPSKKNYLLNDLKTIINKSNFNFVNQEQQLGLGHAILMGKNFTNFCKENDFFGVLLPDDIIISEIPSLLQLIKIAQEKNCSVIGVQEVPKELTSSYGIVSIQKKMNDNLFKISSLVEKPLPENAPSNLAIIGRYILSNKIFNFLENIQHSVGQEIQLTDAIDKMIKNGEDVYAYKIQGKRFDIGIPQGWLKAVNEISLLNNCF